MTTSTMTAALAGIATAVLLSTGAPSIAEESDRTVVLGIGGSFEPVFPGSREMQLSPEPIVDARFGRFFIGERGFGADVVFDQGTVEVTLGTAIGLGEGRKEEDDRRFRGLGDLDPAAELALFADVEWGPVEFGATLATDVAGGHGGTLLTLAAGLENDLTDRLSYEVGVSTIYGDAAYVRALYGVSSLQATRSGYAASAPGAGFTQASLDVSMRYEISETWFAEAGVGVGILLGDARKAPFLTEDTFTTARIGVGRRFRF